MGVYKRRLEKWQAADLWGFLGHHKGFGLYPTSNGRPGKVWMWPCLPCWEPIARLQRVDARELEGRLMQGSGQRVVLAWPGRWDWQRWREVKRFQNYPEVRVDKPWLWMVRGWWRQERGVFGTTPRISVPTSGLLEVPVTEMVTLGGGWTKNSNLDMLSLRCLWDTGVEM